MGGEVPDIVAPGLKVLFCGINPGSVSGALGQHFARPGNRFWKVLFGAGFTARLLAPAEQWDLLSYGLGITNLVGRTTAAAADLAGQELREGARTLERKAARLRPDHVAVLGAGAYRIAFRRPHAAIGPQAERLAAAHLWVLPNPSGLQARYQLPEMVSLYGQLAVAAGCAGAASPGPQR
ncbi:MAG: G/U mismatch-specific DNA glycosylase [Acidimicrobiales bacterium]